MSPFSDSFAIVFDFDGTLGLAEEHRGGQEWILDVIHRKLPEGVRPLSEPPVKRATSDFDFVKKQVIDEYQEPVLQSLLENNIAMIDRGLQVPPDLDQVIHALSLRYPLFVYSGRDHASLLYGCETLGVAKYFKQIIGAEDDMLSKPEPSVLIALAMRHDIPMDRIVYVGDSQSDLLVAQNAGCNFVQAAWLQDRTLNPHEWPVCRRFSHLGGCLEAISVNNCATFAPI